MSGAPWVPFEGSLGSRQKLPPWRRAVLVRLTDKPEEGLPHSLAVGYLKFAAGDPESPRFIIPGIGGIPTHWWDCLGDGAQEYLKAGWREEPWP